MQNLKSYLISDPQYFTNDKDKFRNKLTEVLKNHKIDVACFRDKSSQNFEELAKIFLDICKEFKVPRILINSNIELAEKLGFCGVHLNSTQFDKIEFAKSLNLFTAISCHNETELELAYKKSVDFATYSPIFDTPNKGEAKGIKKLEEVINNFPNLKIIALGGIISQNQIELLKDTKAYGFASIRYFV
ncbi:thiamine phosphate synthase [Arcobacter vandammei]|uniref:thiamine phosphate synthase n=1 Tax=Arcobacter vandammei TaxID=2782243 RepID=UPI0018DF6DA9|nr:thiamine phosphate synthase [Arcobacter vandammei]